MADDTFTCTYCGQDSASQAALEEHIQQMHPEMTDEAPKYGTEMPGMQGTPGAEDEIPRP